MCSSCLAIWLESLCQCTNAELYSTKSVSFDIAHVSIEREENYDSSTKKQTKSTWLQNSDRKKGEMLFATAILNTQAFLIHRRSFNWKYINNTHTDRSIAIVLKISSTMEIIASSCKIVIHNLFASIKTNYYEAFSNRWTDNNVLTCVHRYYLLW